MNKMYLTILGASSLICALGLQAHEHHAEPDLAETKGAMADGPIISGGYQYVPGLLVLPKEVNIKHAHGLARDDEDNIYLGYESNHIDANTRAIIQFDKHGKFVRYIGDASLAEGEPHGLDLVYENGIKYLYLSNNGHTVRKLTIDGEVVWKASSKPDSEIYQGKTYKPTDTATHPSTNQLYVADGYGNGKIVEANKNTGDFAKGIWDGATTGEQFSTPHGITFDPRSNAIVVSDRERHRLVYYDKNGHLLDSVKGQGISRACNADVWDGKILVTNLDGTVAYLDDKNELIDVIKLNEVLGDKGHKYPQDSIFMSNGDIVIGTWNPGKLSYWRKI